jgi:predicted permease
MKSLRYTLRQLARRPGFSVVAILMLSLGIGATTAIFSLFHQILLRPLPVPEPERLVNLIEPGPKWGWIWSDFAVRDAQETAFSFPMYRDLQAQQSVFTGIAAHHSFEANLSNGRRTLSGRGTLVSGNYFDVLSLRPALGRLIGPQDVPRAGESAVAVLSHDYWRSHFGADPNVVDRTLTVNGQSLTIVGVAPEGFSGTALGWRPQIFVPLTLRWLMQPTVPPDAEVRGSYWLYLFARLRPDVTIEQASAAINSAYGAILTEVEAPALTLLPDEERQRFVERRVGVEAGARGKSPLPATAAQPLTLLLGVTALVLLIVCLNLANLLLARGASRSGEMAIRASIGASRGRLVSQVLTESAVLAAIGGGASLPVAALTLGSIAGVVPQQIAAGLAIELGPAAMLFALAVTLATVLLFGLAPAWQASDTEPGRVMKGQATQVSAGSGMARFRIALTTTQIAFSMVLLVLAGLFTQSLINVARVDLGIEVDSLASFTISPRLNGYSPERADALYERITSELATEPGVAGVSFAGFPLIADRVRGYAVSGDGFEWAPGVDTFAQSNTVRPGFFGVVSIPLLAGRDFDAGDRTNPNGVAIVNEAFLRKFDLGSEPLGKRFTVPFTDFDVEVVGVVGDAKYADVKSAIQPQFFTPLPRAYDSTSMFFFARGGMEGDALTRAITRVVSTIDPELPVSDLTTMAQQVDDNVYIDRLITMLSASFAALATLLAAIGLYGVLAYNVAQRTRELGLRLALGAEPATLQGMVLRQVGVMALVGGVIGLVTAIGLGRAASALLFGLSGYEPAVLVAAVAVLAAVVLGATYVPARRASSIAPMAALRYE